ncbi:MAG TPA: FAD-dependent oxidoreductase, partial [Rhodothermales bacterium]
TFMVADDADSAAVLRRRYDFQKANGIDVQWMTTSEMLEAEPFLSPRLVAGVYSRSDHGVDNRKVLAALRKGILDRRGKIREHCEVREIRPHPKKPSVLTAHGDRIEGDAVVLCAGAWSKLIPGIDEAKRPPVRPVKGQMVELRVEAPFALRHVVRGPHAYMTPKSDGRLLVGATMEEMGFDTRVTAGGIYKILEGAWEIVPGIYDLPMLATFAGLRPASRDNEPLLGASEAPGVFYATGHYRHGIMLTPVSAQEIARLVVSGETSAWIGPFAPTRKHS